MSNHNHNFRALCAELVLQMDAMDDSRHWDDSLYERAQAALAQPEPQGVSDEAIMQLACISLGYEYTPSLLSSPENGIGALEALTSELLAFARAAIAADRARFGRPAIEPVAVTERLPGPEDCDAEGRCWLGHSYEPEEDNAGPLWHLLPVLILESPTTVTHWLPAHSLPVPQQEVE